MNVTKVALIGFGGIARAHNVGYSKLMGEGEPVKLVAVCDVNPAQFEAALKINIDLGANTLPEDIHTYTNVEELLANEDFDVADICLPTYLHCEYTIKCLEAGKHVLCEKPMALSTEQCDRMIDAARRNDRKLMIGQCLRFHDSYRFLKACIDDGRYGKLRHLTMERLCAMPRWGHEHWFEDTDRCGGCILDMHVHDVDMARFLLGEPDSASTVTLDRDIRWQFANTRLHYGDVPVFISASWDEAATCNFKSGFRARLEKATLITEKGGVTVYPDEGEPFKAASDNPYIAEEIRTFVHELRDGQKESDINPASSARQSVKLIEVLRESAAKNGEIIKL